MTEIIELPGSALLYGSNMMREPHWEWRGTDKMLPQAAWLLKIRTTGEDAAILRIFFRMLKTETRTFRAVGIGGVWTRPDLRGRGYGTELLAAALDKIRAEQPSADVVILHTACYTGFYSHLGFHKVAEGLYAVSIHGDVTLGDGPWCVEPEGHF